MTPAEFDSFVGGVCEGILRAPMDVEAFLAVHDPHPDGDVIIAALSWFALSTAASLREMLRTGEPMVVKSTFDPRLFKKPVEEPSPPVDDQGRL